MKKIPFLLLLVVFLCTACSQTSSVLEEPLPSSVLDVTEQAPTAPETDLEAPPLGSASNVTAQTPTIPEADLEAPPLGSVLDVTEQTPTASETDLEEPPLESVPDAADQAPNGPETDLGTPSPESVPDVMEQAPTIPETEDHILLTLEAPLADGRVLTLEAIGKVLNKYSCGVREVQVYDGDNLLQTILVRKIQESQWGDGFDDDFYDYTNCWSPEQSMEVLDLNFDGNTDFGLFGWVANNTIPYYYWQWDGEQYQYTYLLQGVEVHPETGEVSSENKHGWGGAHYQWNYYRPDENGILYLVRQERECTGYPNMELDRGWCLETWIPREGVVIRPHPSEQNEDEVVLIRREVPVYEVHGNRVSHFTEIWELKDGHLQMTSREEYIYN